GLLQFDNLRDQQDLALHAISRKRGLQLFIDDALMRGVLVHDNEAVAGLRHDVGLVDLRACRTQRPIEQVSRWCFLKPHVRARGADLERSLPGFGERSSGSAFERRQWADWMGRRAPKMPIRRAR